MSTKEELSKVKTDVKDIHKKMRNNNMIINGLAEKLNENSKDAALSFFHKLVPDLKSDSIIVAYRVCKNSGDGEVNRALFVKFRDSETKASIMKKKNLLYKDKSLGLKSVFCNDDLTEENRLLRQEMREIARYAKEVGYSDAKVMGDKLHVQGKIYTEGELHLLPENVLMENVRTRLIRDGIGFSSKYSYLSNYFPTKVEINGQVFISSEQAYQYNKAIICNRDDIAKSIKNEWIPRR